MVTAAGTAALARSTAVRLAAAGLSVQAEALLAAGAATGRRPGEREPPGRPGPPSQPGPPAPEGPPVLAHLPAALRASGGGDLAVAVRAAAAAAAWTRTAGYLLAPPYPAFPDRYAHATLLGPADGSPPRGAAAGGEAAGRAASRGAPAHDTATEGAPTEGTPTDGTPTDDAAADGTPTGGTPTGGTPTAAAGISLGLLLLAPRSGYPAHQHPAEEVYLPLTRARWLDPSGALLPRAPGSVLHHRPWQPHAMLTGDVPLLAVYVWTGDVITPSRFCDAAG